MSAPGLNLPGTSVEIVDLPPSGQVRHALFDFDGTLSTIRDGWQDFMVPMMVDTLLELQTGESETEILSLVKDFVDHLTGKQTIYQMIRLAEEVAKRGGTPLEPLEYKRRYNARIEPLAGLRIQEIKSGRARPSDFMIPGSAEFLAELHRRGVKLYLASGTDVEFVRDEARVLGVEPLFEGRIFGALANYKDFSKEKITRKIIEDYKLAGPELLMVGDGYVEIEVARRVGAVAFGVYTEERNRYHMNTDKRGRLLKAGAHILAPDLSHGRAALDYLKVGG